MGQQGHITRVWAEKGTRPRAPKDKRFSCVYIFGAVCPERDIGAALIEPYANTVAMNRHLEEISLHVDDDAHAVLVMDQAAWHTTKKCVIPDNITIIYLPPASPELNPVENIWQFLKHNYLCNRVFPTYDTILDACQHAWNSLLALPEKIRDIATREWALHKNVN